MVTVKTNKPHRFNKGVNIGGIVLQFDASGLADVMERHVEVLLKGGVKLADKEDIKKHAELMKEIEATGKASVVPDVDLHDKNAKLKAENAKLLKENEALKVKIAKFEKIEPESKETGNETKPTNKADEDLSVDNMTKADLVELCKEIKFPEAEWKKLGVDKLKAYVKSKL